MKLSLRLRLGVVAGVIAATGLAGCQTCRDCIDRIPRPELPSLGSVAPFRKAPTYAEPYKPPTSKDAAPTHAEPLVIPKPSPSTTRTPAQPGKPAQLYSPPVAVPPALPPFEPEAPVPSAGLFPPSSIRKMGHEVSSTDHDSKIVQTSGFMPVVSSCGPAPCCPPPCCPTPCCPPVCCPTDCCSSSLSSTLLGNITHPLYATKYKLQSMADRVKCKLSTLRSCCSPCDPCCDPCFPCPSPCDPCGPCGVVNEYVMEGVVVGQYPLNGRCSSCATGHTQVPTIPMQPTGTGMMHPPHTWQQPTQPPCACQTQHSNMQYQPGTQYHGGQRTYAQPYQQTWRAPAAQQSVTQQPVARQYQAQPAQQPQFTRQHAQQQMAPSQQSYSAPQTVAPQPAIPSPQQPATSAPPATTSLSPGHAPLRGYAPVTRVSGTHTSSNRYR